MPYRLKKGVPAFQVIREGEFEYHLFTHGRSYNKIPPQDVDKFDVIETEPNVTPIRYGRRLLKIRGGE